jgi:hypothetical protein
MQTKSITVLKWSLLGGIVLIVVFVLAAAGLFIFKQASLLPHESINAAAAPYRLQPNLKDLFLHRGDYVMQSCCDHSYVQGALPDGTPAEWFEVRRGDSKISGSFRSEKRFLSNDYARPLTFEFEIYTPEDWVEDEPFVTVIQWHGAKDAFIFEPGRPPVLKLMIVGRQWVVTKSWDNAWWSALEDANVQDLLRIPFEPGVLTKWRFDTVWATDGSGRIKVTKDGETVVRDIGPNAHLDLVPPYLKYGVYVPQWQFEEQPDAAVRRVAFKSASMAEGSFADLNFSDACGFPEPCSAQEGK